MCGIAGFIGFKGRTVNTGKFSLLLLRNRERGFHATGIYSKGEVLKAAIPVNEMIQKGAYHKIIANSNLVIGHTRAATTGSATSDTGAHPFSSGDITGVHNGGLFKELIPKLQKQHKLEDKEVDSQYIFDTISKNYKDNWDFFGDIEGTMALAFVASNKMYLYRRDSRPLFIGESEEGIYYSSLEDSLHQIGCSVVNELIPWYLYEFKDGIVDKLFIPKYPKIKSLEVDASTSLWANNKDLTQPERAFISEVREEERLANVAKYKNNRNNTEKAYNKVVEDLNKESRTKNSNHGFTNLGNPELFSDYTPTAVEGLEAIEKEIENHARVLDINVTKESTEILNSKTMKMCILAINLFDETSKSQWLPQMAVWVKGHPSVYAVTTDNGQAALKIPTAMLGKSFDLYVADPYTKFKIGAENADFIIEDITIKHTGILEVFLSIPFPLKGETQKRSNAGNDAVRSIDRSIGFRQKGAEGIVVIYLLSTTKTGRIRMKALRNLWSVKKSVMVGRVWQQQMAWNKRRPHDLLKSLREATSLE